MTTAVLVLVVTWSFSFMNPLPGTREVVWGPYPSKQRCLAVRLDVLGALVEQGVSDLPTKLSGCTETVGQPKGR